MEKNKWYFIVTKKMDVPFISIDPLIDKVIKFLITECGIPCAPFFRQEEITGRTVLFDLPGMFMTDRSYCDFEFEGIKLQIPIEDLEDLLTHLKKNSFMGKTPAEFKIIRGFNSCLVLTLTQAEVFKEILEKTLKENKDKIIAEDIEKEKRLRIAEDQGILIRK